MNWIALSAAWAVARPFLEKLGKASKKLWALTKKYWKELIALAIVIFLVSFAYNKGVKDGMEESDDAWIAKYNEAVTDFNERMTALKGKSDTTVEIVDKATDELGKDLNAITDKLADEAKKPSHSQSNSVCTPMKATLNTELPDELFKAWAEMNEAGAKHNPYADTKIGDK